MYPWNKGDKRFIPGILSSDPDDDEVNQKETRQNVESDKKVRQTPEEDKTLASELSSLSTDSSSHDLLLRISVK